MRKISIDEAMLSTTMFLSEEEIDNRFEKLFDDEITRYKETMSGLTTKEALVEFVRDNTDALEMLTSILGIAEEKVKRVFSMLRLSKGFTFESEWSLSATRTKMLENPEWMDSICDLMMNGANEEKFKVVIPRLYLKDFVINNQTLARLSNKDFMLFLLRNKYKTKHDTAYSLAYTSKIEGMLKDLSEKYGLTYSSVSAECVGRDYRNNTLTFIENGEKRVLINFNFNLTTGSGQEKYSKRINHYYRYCRNCDCVMINMLDGAGWIARSNSYKAIYNNCHFFLNLSRINEIENIICETFNIEKI